MSASAGSTAEKRDYNEHAIRTAEKLTAARKAAAKRAWESSPNMSGRGLTVRCVALHAIEAISAASEGDSSGSV